MKVVFFDLGDTLIHPHKDWEAIWPSAIAALQAELQQAAIPQDADFPIRFRAVLDAYYARRDDDLREPGMAQVLQTALVGQAPLPTDTLNALLRPFYRVTQANWQADPQARPLLQELSAAGWKLAIISNAADDEDVQTLTARFGFTPYLAFSLTSAACGYRKPHPRIFRQALSRMGCLARQAVMIGDRPNADIRGAKGVGMRAIWAARWAKTDAAPGADAIAHQLAHIPALLRQLAC